MTLMQEVLNASLGDYSHIGFTLHELDDHFLELRFMGKHVGYFSSVGATIAGIHEACQIYLRAHEFGENDGNTDKNTHL